MSDFLALIRACKAEPDDDAPRLVLADWLDDHGDAERAAFIRRQIANSGSDVDGKATPAAWTGAWGQWADDWHRRESYRDWDYPLRFDRGFLHVRDGYRELYDAIPDILNPPFDWTWVESIKFGSWHNGDWSPLFASPRLLELTSLVFIDDHYRSNLIPPLAACPQLVNLHKLWLSHMADGHGGLSRLSQCQHLSGLREFTFDISNAGKAAARAFAQSQVWDRLNVCRLWMNQFGDAGLAELAGGRIRPRLKVLDVSRGGYSDAGLMEFAKSDRFPVLERLLIGYSVTRDGETAGFGRRAIEALLTAPVGGNRHLVVGILSAEPVPNDIQEIAEAHPDRVTIEYRKWIPVTSPDFLSSLS